MPFYTYIFPKKLKKKTSEQRSKSKFWKGNDTFSFISGIFLKDARSYKLSFLRTTRKKAKKKIILDFSENWDHRDILPPPNLEKQVNRRNQSQDYIRLPGVEATGAINW